MPLIRRSGRGKIHWLTQLWSTLAASQTQQMASLPLILRLFLTLRIILILRVIQRRFLRLRLRLAGDRNALPRRQGALGHFLCAGKDLQSTLGLRGLLAASGVRMMLENRAFGSSHRR